MEERLGRAVQTWKAEVHGGVGRLSEGMRLGGLRVYRGVGLEDPGDKSPVPSWRDSLQPEDRGCGPWGRVRPWSCKAGLCLHRRRLCPFALVVQAKNSI